MSFSGSSFNLWLDANLTEPFSGTKIIVNKTDLSDNPQDFLFYFGSPLADRQLQTATNPGVSYITFTPIDSLPEWQASTAYIIGNKVQPIGGNGFVYVCSTAGVSGSSEPSWPTTPIGVTIANGTCVWTLVAAHHPKTEIKLALSSLGLSSAIAGAALNVALTVFGGVVNAVPVYMRITNTVTTSSNSTGNEETGVTINSCIESEIP